MISLLSWSDDLDQTPMACLYSTFSRSLGEPGVRALWPMLHLGAPSVVEDDPRPSLEVASDIEATLAGAPPVVLFRFCLAGLFCVL